MADMTNRSVSSPIPVAKSVRPDIWRGLTSGRAGVCNVLAYIPLLREDRIRGNVNVSIKMAETLHVLANPVRVSVMAHLIPHSAMERFEGSMELFNRSAMGVNRYDDTPSPVFARKWLVPAVQTIPGMGQLNQLGVHVKSGENINGDLIEAYNMLWNFRARNRSRHISQRALDAGSLAPAFWTRPNFNHIKPSFDQAMMEGIVDMSVDGMLPVKGLGIPSSEYTTPVGNFNLRQTFAPGETPVTKATNGLRTSVMASPNVGEGRLAFEMNGNFPAIFAEMKAANVTMSLANLEMAKKTQAWAALRQRYSAIEDQYLVDLLMQGIRIPDTDLQQPILLGAKSTIFGQMQRYATDGASLDQSVANGRAALSFMLHTPPINSGGVILITCEILPEPLDERITDPYLYQFDPAERPNAQNDYLDPEKVEVVQNEYVDHLHGDPAGVFGYAPLNHRWARSRAMVGGKFKRPNPDTFKEERQRIWASDVVDPQLTEDFYVAPQPFPHDVFADTVTDPFEFTTLVQGQIVGSTVFGAGLQEDDGHYLHIMDQIDQDRIAQEAAALQDADAKEAERLKTVESVADAVVKAMQKNDTTPKVKAEKPASDEGKEGEE